LVTFTAHRFDQVETEFRSQAAYTHVDDVRSGVEVVPPYRGQKPDLGYRLAGMIGQFPQQEEFQPGQRYRAMPGIRGQPSQVQAQLADPDDLVVVARRILVMPGAARRHVFSNHKSASRCVAPARALGNAPG
jgi:hypothetical protein